MPKNQSGKMGQKNTPMKIPGTHFCSGEDDMEEVRISMSKFARNVMSIWEEV